MAASKSPEEATREHRTGTYVETTWARGARRPTQVKQKGVMHGRSWCGSVWAVLHCCQSTLSERFCMASRRATPRRVMRTSFIHRVTRSSVPYALGSSRAERPHALAGLATVGADFGEANQSDRKLCNYELLIFQNQFPQDSPGSISPLATRIRVGVSSLYDLVTSSA